MVRGTITARNTEGYYIMSAMPFLVKFASPISSDGAENGTYESSKSVEEKSQNRPRSTIVTKVDRETTDDR